MEELKKPGNDAIEQQSEKKVEDIKKSNKELFIEQITEKFNLAFIPLDVIEDIRIYKEEVSFMDKFIHVLDAKVENPDLNLFYRGIIYGTQVVLRKILNGPLNEDQIKVINKLMNIDELEDDISVSLVHGICFKYTEMTDTEKIKDEGSKLKDVQGSPVFLVREWIKGKSFWKFRNSKEEIGKSDLLSILYSLARILEHYHKYSLPYLFLRPKKIIVGSDFSVILNDIIKLNSFYFNNKIRYQLDDKIKIVDQNRFLHPFLFYYANVNESLKTQMFELYQSFDLYSFGCMCYLFYFSTKGDKLLWNKMQRYSDIFEAYYGKSFEEFKRQDDKKERTSHKIFLPPQTDKARENVIKRFFDEEEYQKYMSLKDENKDNYDIKLLKLVINCICPEIDNKKEFCLKYTMKSAVEELLKIDCVKKFKKTKEFNYNFQKGKKLIIFRL